MLYILHILVYIQYGKKRRSRSVAPLSCLAFLEFFDGHHGTAVLVPASQHHAVCPLSDHAEDLVFVHPGQPVPSPTTVRRCTRESKVVRAR